MSEDKNNLQVNDDFVDKITFPLFKQQEPGEQQDLGGFHAQYASEDGGLVKYNPKKTKYSATVEMLLAVDGWEDQSKTQRMTVLVFQYEVKTSNTDGRFATVNAWIDLEDIPDAAESTRAIPDLQAWGPFATTKTWNQTEEPVSTKNTGGATLGGGAMGFTAQAHAEQEKNRERKERFFDKGQSKLRYSTKDGRRNGVMWTLTQNKATNEGVAHKFCLALLFNRERDTPFEITFGLRCNAGLLNKFDNWFGLGPNFDKKNKYVPLPDKPRVRYAEGKELRELVDPENLGELCKKDGKGSVNLLKLTSVESLRGLEPLNK